MVSSEMLRPWLSPIAQSQAMVPVLFPLEHSQPFNSSRHQVTFRSRVSSTRLVSASRLATQEVNLILMVLIWLETH